MSAAARAKASHPIPEGADLLKNRRFAAIVLAAVVILGVPLGSARSLRHASKQVEAQFFTGVKGRGAIADFLEDASAAALGLVTVGAKYDAAQEETGKLRMDRSWLLDAQEEEDIALYAAANALVVKSFGALKDKLWSLELSEQDAADVEYYASQFEGAQGAVNHAGYNEAVEEFTEKTYDRFPASLFAGLLGVEPPEKFE